MTINRGLLIVSLILFVLAAVGVDALGPLSTGWTGLAFFAAAHL